MKNWIIGYLLFSWNIFFFTQLSNFSVYSLPYTFGYCGDYLWCKAFVFHSPKKSYKNLNFPRPGTALSTAILWQFQFPDHHQSIAHEINYPNFHLNMLMQKREFDFSNYPIYILSGENGRRAGIFRERERFQKMWISLLSR